MPPHKVSGFKGIESPIMKYIVFDNARQGYFVTETVSPADDVRVIARVPLGEAEAIQKEMRQLWNKFSHLQAIFNETPDA